MEISLLNKNWEWIQEYKQLKMFEESPVSQEQ